MSHKKIDNNLVAKHKSELTLKLNKSAYVGMCILSYWCTNSIMITLKKKKDNQLKLLCTDTNRWMYQIKTGYVYEDVSCDKEMYGFSNY